MENQKTILQSIYRFSTQEHEVYIRGRLIAKTCDGSNAILLASYYLAAKGIFDYGINHNSVE